jgi:biotin carboxyl carrier protein
MDAMNLLPHVIQRVSWTAGANAPTASVQNRTEKLITPRRFWSEKTVTIMKFIALGLTSAALAGCSKSPELDPRTQPVSVLVARVGAPIAETESFTGVVTARVQSDLVFRVPGKVTKRFVDTGQKVHIGEPLMQIDVTDYAHAIATQTENVAALRAKAKQAAADEVRYRGLVSTGAIAASTYDQVKATADAAQAQLASAEAQEKVARDQGDYSLLLADSDGTVVQTLAKPGQVVAAGQTVIKLAHAGPREAAVYLPETLRPALGSEAHAVLYGETVSVPVWLRQLFTVTAAWPGATAQEMQDLVAEPLEKRMQELTYYDHVDTFTRPGLAFLTVTLKDYTPPEDVQEEFYQGRKKIQDEASRLPQGVLPPVLNDEYTDVTFSVYALEAPGLPLRTLTREAETLRQDLLHVPGVKKVNVFGERPERIFVQFSYDRIATLGVSARDIFDGLVRQNAVTPSGSIDTRNQQVYTGSKLAPMQKNQLKRTQRSPRYSRSCLFALSS